MKNKLKLNYSFFIIYIIINRMQSLSIIDSQDAYISRLSTVVNENKYNYRNFIIEIDTLLRRNGFSGRDIIIDFLKRSFISLIELNLQISEASEIEYQVQDEGRLHSPSKQCLFTFAFFNNVLYFIKVVDYNKQLSWDGQDLLLFDIITGFIFKKIITSDDKKYISETKYSFLSYYKYNKYNYKEIYDGYLDQLELFKDGDMRRCYVSMTTAINGSTIYDIFYTENDKEKCKLILKKIL